MADLILTGYLSAHISCDEGQSVWMGDFILDSVESYARTRTGDTLEMEIMGDVYSLRVDSKGTTRSLGDDQYHISAISPLGFLDAPHAAEITVIYNTPVDARAAVEDILGETVVWDLPLWAIPAGALSITGATPLQAAKTVVEAVGGLIESFPNGDIHCRFRNPVDIQGYSSSAIDHYFTNSDWITLGSTDAPSKGFNRVTLSNALSESASQDRLESVADPEEGTKATIRAYLYTERPVILVHTGAPETVIASRGLVERSEEELVEFIASKGSLKYAPASITGLVWQHNNLGTVAFSGTDLTASVDNGYSLAKITYTVKSINWDVSLALPEEVQFILVDA